VKLRVRLYTDGGARGNPGPAAFGCEHGAVLGLEHEPIRGRAGIAARAAVRE